MLPEHSVEKKNPKCESEPKGISFIKPHILYTNLMIF